MKKLTPLLFLIVINFITHAQTALDFNPSEGLQKVDIPNITCPTEVTIEAWINIRGLGSYPTIFEIGDDAPFFGLESSGSKITLYSATASNSSVPLNEWTHVAATYSTINQEVKIYINGVLDITESNQSQDVSGIGGGIGYNGSDDVFNGAIDEVRIWSRVLSEDEIDANKSVCLSGNETGLYAYYSFNEGSGTTVNDLGPNNFDGTLVNMDPATDWVAFDSCDPTTHFVTTWNTNNTSGADITSITISTLGSGYNYDVDWNNDGVFDQFGLTGSVTYDFGAPGIYTIRIQGAFPQIYFNAWSTLGTKLSSVDQWGIIEWRSFDSAFHGCQNVEFLATDIPDLSQVTDMSSAFRDCFSAQFNPSIRDWDISNVEDLSATFQNATSFNQDIGTWDVSSVNALFRTFSGATSFNQDIGIWDVRNVNNMRQMFDGAISFDQSLENWDIGNLNNGSFDGANGMFNGITLSTANYDALLVGWSTDSSGTPGDGIDDVPSNIPFSGGNSKYCLGEPARNTLTDALGFNWGISDGGQSCPEDYFITTWQTDIDDPASTSITLPAGSLDDVYNYDVDWTYDGINFNAEEVNVTGLITHDYGTPGTYTVAIRGQFPRISFDSGFETLKIIRIEQWGSQIWTSMEQAFAGCLNINITNPNIDSPDLSQVTSTNSMFRSCFVFDGDVSNWNVSNVIDMGLMFRENTIFNQNLNAWDVSNVTNMERMFERAAAFNGDISSWNVSSVGQMANMFEEASAFNTDISQWNTQSVSTMEDMFKNAVAFNQDIGGWNTSVVQTMEGMFEEATSFNQDISLWNVSSVVNMEDMFQGATAFDQNIGSWDIGSLSNSGSMFANVILSTSNYDALLIGWSTDSSSIPGDGIDDVPSNIPFSAGSSMYCQGETARNTLTDPSGFNWTITDGGLDCSTLSTGDIANSGELTIHPNPAQDHLYISGNHLHLIEQLRVYDINGRLIIQSKSTERIDVSELSKGVYILELTSAGTAKSTKKFMKQ